MDSEVIRLTTHTRFRRVTWADLKPGDIVYYQLWHEGKDAGGPLTVADPATCCVVNASGVPIRDFDRFSYKLLVRLPDEPTPVVPDAGLRAYIPCWPEDLRAGDGRWLAEPPPDAKNTEVSHE